MTELENPLAEFLKNENMSISEISDELMVSYTSVYSWINGRTTPSHGNMRNLSRLLDMSSGVLKLRWRRWLDSLEEEENNDK